MTSCVWCVLVLFQFVFWLLFHSWCRAFFGRVKSKYMSDFNYFVIFADFLRFSKNFWSASKSVALLLRGHDSQSPQTQHKFTIVFACSRP